MQESLSSPDLSSAQCDHDTGSECATSGCANTFHQWLATLDDDAVSGHRLACWALTLRTTPATTGTLTLARPPSLRTPQLTRCLSSPRGRARPPSRPQPSSWLSVRAAPCVISRGEGVARRRSAGSPMTSFLFTLGRCVLRRLGWADVGSDASERRGARQVPLTLPLTLTLTPTPTPTPNPNPNPNPNAII